MPAWMTQGGKGGAAPSAGGDGHVPGYSASGHSNGSSAPPAARPGGAGGELDQAALHLFCATIPNAVLTHTLYCVLLPTGSSNAYANYNYGGGGAPARPGGMGGMLMPPQMQQQVSSTSLLWLCTPCLTLTLLGFCVALLLRAVVISLPMRHLNLCVHHHHQL